MCRLVNSASTSIVIECEDLVDVLCRALDHTRRMGIELISVCAHADEQGSDVHISVHMPDPQLAAILRERIGQIREVKSIRFSASTAALPTPQTNEGSLIDG